MKEMKLNFPSAYPFLFCSCRSTLAYFRFECELPSGINPCALETLHSACWGVAKVQVALRWLKSKISVVSVAWILCGINRISFSGERTLVFWGVNSWHYYAQTTLVNYTFAKLRLGSVFGKMTLMAWCQVDVALVMALWLGFRMWTVVRVGRYP